MSQRVYVQNTCEERDWGRDPRTALRLWGPPILLIVLGSVVSDIPEWPLEAAGLIWSGSILWLGISCLRNARRCGRFHCTVLSLVYPLLGLVALGLTFGWVRVRWNPFWTFFILITLLAFLPEFFGLTYIGPLSNNRKGAAR